METSYVFCRHFFLDSANDYGFDLIELLFTEMIVALMPAMTNVVLGPLDEGLSNVPKPCNSP